MDATLVLAGLAAGVAASPHCALMCSAPCALATGGCSDADAKGPARFGRQAAFQLGRVASYAAGGALAAGSVALLGQWARTMPTLRPAWALLHLGLLALGLFWLVRGRQPDWMQREQVAPLRWAGKAPKGLSLARPGLIGLGWVALPCVALQAALLLAALASSAAGGAMVMAAFAIASMPALLAAPLAWMRRSNRKVSADGAAALGLRLAGAGLALASGWALTQGLWLRLIAWCAS